MNHDEIAEAMISLLSDEDWKLYDNQDLYEICGYIYGEQHPLVVEYYNLMCKEDYDA